MPMTISTFSPMMWTIGGGAFQLTVNGSNFPANAQVQWNGTPLTPVKSSATQLVVEVSSAQIVTDGTVSITVHDPAGALSDVTTTYTSMTPTTPEGVDLAIGIGSLVGGAGVSNYQISSANVLSRTNFGNQTPQFLAGISLPFCLSQSATRSGNKELCGGRSFGGQFINRAAAFVSLQLASGSSQTFSGYTIGLSEHISKYLHVMVGYSLSPIQEISTGLQQKYPGTTWDGFQVPSTYTGPPLTVHYRGGVFIGIALPLSLKSLLTGTIAAN